MVAIQIRKYADADFRVFCGLLRDAYWVGYFKGTSTEDFRALADRNQKLLHWSMSKCKNSSTVTANTIPWFFPLCLAIKNPSSQMFTALEAFLFSPPFEICLQVAPSNPQTVLHFINYWSPALTFFADRFEIRHPQRVDNLPQDIHDKYVDIESDCLEFLKMGKAERVARPLYSSFVENINDVFIKPIYAWMEELHAFAYAISDRFDGKRLRERMERERKNWLPKTPDQLWAELNHDFPSLSGKQECTDASKMTNSFPYFKPEKSLEPKLFSFNIEGLELYYGNERLTDYLNQSIRYLLMILATNVARKLDFPIPRDKEIVIKEVFSGSKKQVARAAKASSIFKMLGNRLGRRAARILMHCEKGLGYRLGKDVVVKGGAKLEHGDAEAAHITSVAPRGEAIRQREEYEGH